LNTDRDMDANAWASLTPYIETTNLMVYVGGVPSDPWASLYKVRLGDTDRDIKVWSCGPDRSSGDTSSTNGGDDVRSW